MKVGTSIYILVWLMAISFLLLFFLLPSCTHQSPEGERRSFKTLSREDSQGVRPMPNQGWMKTQFTHDTLYIAFVPFSEEKVEAIRIYDEEGGLKYIKKAPDFSRGKKLKVDCTYYRSGEYLILLYIGDRLIEEVIQLD